MILGTEAGAIDPSVAPPQSDRRRFWRLTGVRVFASDADAPRARRPTDVVLLVLSVVTLVVLAFPAPGPTQVDTLLEQLLKAMPGLFGWLWEALYGLLLVWVAFLVVAAVVRRRWDLLRDQVIAGGLALAAATLVGLASGMTWDDLRQDLLTAHPGGVYPAVRLALSVAIVVTASPHLSRPLRRVGRWVIILGGTAGLALGVDLPLGVAAGIALGIGTAALVHLVFGSPGGRAPLDLVQAELADLGIEVSDLRPARSEPRGVAVAYGTASDGRRLLVKVYGRDAWEGSLFASLWTSLWYRDVTPVTSVGRQRQVEHEAFLTLLAERAGVPVQPVLAAGTAWGRDALLVRRDDGRALDDVPAAEVSPDLLRGLWAALGRLHDAHLAHGRVSADSLVVLDDGGAALTDLSVGTSSPDEARLLADDAQLLVTTAVSVGPAAAVAPALQALGAERLSAVAPYLQPAAVDQATRRAVKQASWSMGDLRQAVTDATGAEPPKLERLRRVSWTSVAMLAVLILVAYAVISAVAGIGLDTLVDEFKGASWGWIAAAILLSPVIQVGQAFATIGASTREVRFGPVLALQYAIQFVGLAVPSTAGKLALEIRFFQLVGTNPTGAVSIALIDSLAGFVVQVLVILLTLFTGLVTLNFQGTAGSVFSDIDWTRVAIVVAVLLVIAVLLVAFVPRLRRFLGARTADTRVALGVLRSPRKVGLILGGSVAWNVMAALVLGCAVNAFGQHATFAELILVNTIVALFAGLMPIPGNVGVSEAAMTAGLVAIGIPEASALSIAIVYRLATFYLPPIWGFFAMRGLRARNYL